MLKLEYKKISDDTLRAMRDAVGSNHDHYEDAVCAIRFILPSAETHILNCADSCIFTVVESLPEPILTVDMGGWNGFKKSCDILNKKYLEIETDEGMINIESLKNYIEDYEIKSIYITSLCAYTRLQPIEEIYELCNVHDVILILDISGTIGHEKINAYCDVQIASTGSPKIVNCENGGFINNLTQKVAFNKHLLKTFKADNITCAAIANEIKKSPEILQKTVKANTYLKRILSEKLKDDKTHHIIHESYTGTNTIIKTESKKTAKKLAYHIKQELDIPNNKSIITTGPNYNRLKIPSVNVETKNMDIEYLTKGNMDKLAEIVVDKIESS
ncbi:MAG: hypothetical protein BZ137_07465 [Methanosphaera sp. rholeuAM130]|nr:hypothetical protein [Methanosphaera sp.]RAP53163.1 MAG: hypothetical protein BZ137_07465 [Methanosphaera sp. rholeuAM130]